MHRSGKISASLQYPLTPHYDDQGLKEPQLLISAAFSPEFIYDAESPRSMLTERTFRVRNTYPLRARLPIFGIGTV